MSVPPEPNKRIEELLKAYAEQRRKDAGDSLQMPEHTRHLLMRARVAQQTSRSAAPSASRIFRLQLRARAAQQTAHEVQPWHERLMELWPRFAIGGGVAVVAFLLLLMMRPGEKVPPSIATLAKSELITAIAPAPAEQSAVAQSQATQSQGGGALADRSQHGVAKPRFPAVGVVVAKDARQGVESGRKPATDTKLGTGMGKIASATATRPAPSAGELKSAGPTDKWGEATTGRTVARSKSQIMVGGQELERTSAVSGEVKSKLAMKDVASAPLPSAPMPAAVPATAGTGQPAGSNFLGANQMANVSAAAAMPSANITAVAEPEVVSNIAAPNYGARFQKTVSGDAQQAIATQRMRFSQVELRRTAGDFKQQSPAQEQVLASFQLEQRGDRVVIMDADGSTYEGQVQAVPLSQASTDQLTREKMGGQVALKEAPKAASAKAEQAFGFQQRSRAPAQQVFFVLSGTNRSLNQRIVFNGNLSLDEPSPRDTNAPARRMAVMAAPAAAAPAEPAPPAVLRLDAPKMPARVQGKVRLSDGTELNVDAVSVGP